MFSKRSAVLNFVAAATLLPFLSHAQGTFRGVVSDSVNGMPLAGVAVSAGGSSTLTDAKGAFTLVAAGTTIRDAASPAVGRKPGPGALTWKGFAADGRWRESKAGREAGRIPAWLGKAS